MATRLTSSTYLEVVLLSCYVYVLQSNDFLSDVVTAKLSENQPFKFVFKRKICLKNEDGPSSDPVYEHLIYLQVRSIRLREAIRL